MNEEIKIYNDKKTSNNKAICKLLARLFDNGLPGAETKIWHAHPVWFLDHNPMVGYCKQKAGWRLMFWSGADFEKIKLKMLGFSSLQLNKSILKTLLAG
jgi:hypothetical protein